MANKDDYLTNYREFFEYFAETVNPNDQLPVKLASYKLLNVEVIGGIIDWTTQYLTQKKCPPHLFAHLIKIIIEEIRKACKKHPVNYGFNLSDNAYEPLKLMQAVMAKTNEVCLRYLDNSMLCSLPPPSNTYFETSIYAVRNRRRTMEDRHVVIHDLNTMFNNQEANPSSYYAVFDGHAGHDAAAYSSAHLHQFLAENKYFISNPQQALIDAFCKTDALFFEKCKVESLSSGTTAVVALLRPKEKSLYIAWVGDSQALLVNQGKVLQCVNPHKPSREDEKERIEIAGGCVVLWGTWRVNGQLAVSRAIGDAEYKPYVIAIPEIREISLDGGEDFLILACDGLWDYVSEDTVAQEVYYMVAQNPDNTERISQNLVQIARCQGSTDNISIIVVFLREPHKIAEEAHRWATRNGSPLTTNMDTELDNANNPFTNSNGAFKNLDTDNIHLQKNNEGLLLNLSDNFKATGANLTDEIYKTEKSNGTKRSTSDIHSDDDFGPETDVDAVDDAFSPVDKTKSFNDDLNLGFNDGLSKSFNDEVKAFAEGLANNNPLNDDFNPFLKKETEETKDEAVEDECEERGDDVTRFSPAPVQDVGGLEENQAESDSEDEWNYFKGDQAKPETLSSQPETVVETSEEMSQLNPNAAEFVPVSPTRSIPSPACRALINDEVIAQSPKRPVAAVDDINVPNETEFKSEIKSRPSDFDSQSNGHCDENDHNISDKDTMDDILNGKSIDDIPEFHPGSTPAKLPAAEEFHFGPNAAPFTPRALDQSEAFSTKANYGDDTEQILNTSLNESDFTSNKDSDDPMSMSFYAEKGESNPFEEGQDLNKVHNLPENVEEFIQEDEDKENRLFNGSISDLPEHFPLGQPLDNDQAAIQTTDLDKISQDDEKELASPLEPDHEVEILEHHQQPIETSKSPEIDNLLDDFVSVPEKPIDRVSPDTKSPLPAEPESELIIPEIDDSTAKSPIPEQIFELGDSPLLGQSKSPLPEEKLEINELNLALSEHGSDISKSPLLEEEPLTESKSPLPDLSESKSPLPDLLESKSPLPDLSESKSPLPDLSESKSPLLQQEHDDLLESKSPLLIQPELIESSKSPLPNQEFELTESKSPDQEPDILQSKSPLLEQLQQLDEARSEHESSLPSRPESKSSLAQDALEVDDLLQADSQSPLPPDNFDLLESKSPLPVSEAISETKSPVPPQEEPISCDLPKSEAPVVEPSPVNLFDVDQQQETESLICGFRSEIKSPLDNFEKPIVTVEDNKPISSDIHETEFNPKSEVEYINLEAKSPVFQEESVSPVPACEYSTDPSCQFQSTEPESHSPVDLQEQKQEEEITSSVKDDISSPIELLSPVKTPEPQIEEPLVEEHPKQMESANLIIEDTFISEQIHQQEQSLEDTVKEVVSETKDITQEAPQDQLLDFSCPLPSSQPQIESEPIIPREEISGFEQNQGLTLTEALSNGLDVTSEISEQICIKTDNITPEFAEQAVITPSDESKILDEVPAAPLIETPVQEPESQPEPTVPVPKPLQEEPKVPEPTELAQEVVKETPVLAPLPIIPSLPQESKEVKKEEKKTGTTAPARKPLGKTAPAKPSTTLKPATSAKAAPKLSATSPRAAAAPKISPKAGASKLGMSPSKSPAAVSSTTKPSPRPKTAPKSTERKLLTNGDAKPAPRTTLTKKPASEATATKTTARPATAAPKASPTKTTTLRPPTAVSRTFTKSPGTATSKPSTTTTTTTTAKPKVPLSTRITASKTTTKTTTTSTTTTSQATKTLTAPPKPKTLTSISPKPRVPLTKTVTKSADVEKQNKESANKLTASRTTTVAKTGKPAAASKTTTTLKKTETKPLPKRTVPPKPSTTTTKTTTVSKKPGEVKTITKTKTTKVEKPKENGVAPTNITEEISEITIVNNVVETETLVKDNSPIDNKLFTEATNVLIEANSAD